MRFLQDIMLNSLNSPQDWLAARARTTPDKLALVYQDRQWTYGELDRLVDGTAAFLSQKGVSAGNPVAVLSPNSVAYVAMVHGLIRIGAVLVPLNTRLTAPELEWQLTHIGCSHLFYDGHCAEKVPRLAGHRFIPVEFNEQSLEDSHLGLSHGVEFKIDDLQAILFTSGTTGYPKAAMLTYANHFWSAIASAFRLGTVGDDRWLSCLPLYHVGGLAVILRSCLCGIAVILQEGFDLDDVSYALDIQKATLVSLVPTMLRRLLNARGDREWPSSLRLVLLGGAAAPIELIDRCQLLQIPVATTYGLTEAASQVATSLPREASEKPGCVGKPLMFTTVRIVDDNDQAMPPGEYGEVVVSGPTVTAGYLNDQPATVRAIRDGELHTGDIGYLDRDGDLWIVQRRSDMIISGGENVYPAEVEAVLRQHPAVESACVVGVRDQEWGQRVAAMIVPSDERPLSDAELVDFCRRSLAGYKIPRAFRFVTHLPQTASGKIHRKAVAESMNRNAV